jgi:hypothetical protein
VRHALGDALRRIEPLPGVGRADPGKRPRAIEVSILGARSEEARGFAEVRSTEIGPFTLRVLEDLHPAPPARWDLLAKARAPDLEVPGCIFGDGPPASAPGFLGHPSLGRTRFRCGGEPAQDVGMTTIDDERGRPRRCLWAAAPPGGERVLRFARVPLGDRMDGHTGAPWIGERDGARAPVEIGVFVDGDHVADAIHSPGEAWSPFSIPLGARAGRTATVELRIRSADRGTRPLCIEAVWR